MGRPNTTDQTDGYNKQRGTLTIKKYVILLSLILGNLVEQPTPEVTIQQGILRGRVSVDGEVFQYLGIPYATANETNRFQAPFPAPSWDGVYNAIDEHYVCLQLFAGVVPLGQEDCLKINVYTPASLSEPLPVMLFIPGGGFFEGSGNPLIYDPIHFVRRGVVVVTFNYRLNALGFLCLGLKEAPGNAGLKDQLAALRWVQKNILAFGGDPNNVTLFGESAGGGSISYLRLSPVTKGLFKRIIIQSGSMFPLWATPAGHVNTASVIAEQFGYHTNDTAELLKIFKSIDAKTLAIAQRPVKPGHIGVNRVCFIPCIEKEFEGIESIITEPPFETLISGNYTHYPILSGFNDREGIALVGKESETLLREKEELFAEILPNYLGFPSDIDRQNVARRFRELYFGDKPINKDTILNLGEFLGDFYFIAPVLIEADIVSRISTEPMYNYVFKYSGSRNILKIMSGYPFEDGATHADDLFYMFNYNLLPQTLLTKDDRLIIDRLTTMWTNYAKYGDPTPTTSELLPVKWVPSQAEDLKFLYIDRNMSMGELPNPERYIFWKETYTKFRRKMHKEGNTPEYVPWI